MLRLPARRCAAILSTTLKCNGSNDSPNHPFGIRARRYIGLDAWWFINLEEVMPSSPTLRRDPFNDPEMQRIEREPGPSIWNKSAALRWVGGLVVHQPRRGCAI